MSCVFQEANYILGDQKKKKLLSGIIYMHLEILMVSCALMIELHYKIAHIKFKAPVFSTSSCRLHHY